MTHLPLFADLREMPCLVVGGGDVAARKVGRLLAAGARVTVVAPELGAELARRASDGDIDYAAGTFEPRHVAGRLLVIAATADADTNRAVAAAAMDVSCLCNVVDDGELSSCIMPAVVDRSPVVIAVSSDGQSPVLARLLRQRIEAWLPPRIGELASWAGRWRDEVRRRLTTPSERLRFWQQTLEGGPAERLLSGQAVRADAEMQAALDAAAHPSGDHAPTGGAAWIVGAGPGDPGLLTRRGLDYLQRADVVMHDRLVPAAILDFARRDARMIDVGKSPDGPSTSQAVINAQLVDLVRAGNNVCRLKGGDPFVFGRGAEEVAALRDAGLAWHVVPGVTAGTGCAGAAGIALTDRELADAVTMVTAHRVDDAEPDWRHLAGGTQTLVFYMGVRRLEDVSRRLIEYGKAADTPAALIENGTTDRQRIVHGRLDQIAELAESHRVIPPAVLIVGKVVASADKLGWLTATNATSKLAASASNG